MEQEIMTEKETKEETKEEDNTTIASDVATILQVLCDTITTLQNDVGALQKENEILHMKLDNSNISLLEMKTNVDTNVEQLISVLEEIKNDKQKHQEKFTLDSFKSHVIKKVETVETIDEIMTMNKLQDSFKVREIVKKLSPTITTLQELLDNHSIGYLTTIVQDDARKDLSRADREHMVKYFSACEMYNSQTTKFHQTNPELIMHNALRKEYEEIIATVIHVISPESVGNLEQLIACFDPMLSIRTVLSNLASILHFLIFHGISEVIWDPTIHFPSIASIECFLQSRLRDKSFIKDSLNSATNSQDCNDPEILDSTKVSDKTNGAKRKRAMISSTSSTISVEKPQAPTLAPPSTAPPPPPPPLPPSQPPRPSNNNTNYQNYHRDNRNDYRSAPQHYRR